MVCACRFQGRLQLVTTAIKAGFLALVALLPWIMLPLAGHGLAWSNYATTVTPRLPWLLTGDCSATRSNCAG